MVTKSQCLSMLGILQVFMQHMCDGLTNCDRYKIHKISTKNMYKIDSGFYTKYVHIKDVILMSSNKTSDWSLVEAARTLEVVLFHLRIDLVTAFRRQNWKILIYGYNENLCSLPETRGLTCVPSSSMGLTVGNLIVVPRISRQCHGSGFMTYSTLVHELAHAFNAAFNFIDLSLQTQIQRAYDHAKLGKIWPLDQYAMKNVNEYFASLWEPFWFKVDHSCGPDARMCSKDATVNQDPWFNAIMQKLLKRPLQEITDLSCHMQCE